jgi:predicted alpha/beta superfamily hydrolase
VTGHGPGDDRSPLADTEVHRLRPAELDGERTIFVGRCGLDPAVPASVLYLADANGFFGGTVDLVRSLQLARHLPPILVVGIGYPVGVLAETRDRRTRDLTPTADEGFAALFPDQAEMGGAGATLDFIRRELMPWVHDRYEVDPADATFFGHSFGGLFGLSVLFDEPGTFRRYIIGSPSLWWDRRTTLASEGRYAEGHDDLPATVFFGIGADETQDGREREAVNLPEDERRAATAWYIDMVDDMNRLVDQLAGRGYPSLRWQREVFPGEFHVTVPLLTLSRGLRFVYDAPR